MAAQYATAQSINFMIRNARGLVCVPITEGQAERVGLKPMVDRGGDRQGTAFTVSVDLREGTTTGIFSRGKSHDRSCSVGQQRHSGNVHETWTYVSASGQVRRGFEAIRPYRGGG